MLLKITILTILIHSITSVCAYQCSTCSTDSNPYACLSCSSSSVNQYLWSCPAEQYDLTAYIVITVIIVVIHCFSLAMGIGIYRQIFQNIQLVSLTTWRYGFEGSTIALQGTNFGIVKTNNFIDTFGIQFLVVLSILCFFWLVFLLVEKNMHNSTAILIRRKKIIFPIRMQTLIFNMLFFTSLVQVSTINISSGYNIFSFALSIFAIICIVAILIGLAVVSNWKRFQVDDPHYYVLLEQMTSKKWYAKNNIFFSLLTRGLIILIFVLLFKTPQAAGIIITIIQVCYSLYIMAFIRYTKIRYLIIIITANIIVVGIFLIIFIGGISDVGSSSWQQFSASYIVLILVLVAFFFFATLLELILKRDIVIKQVKSIYNRFIKCQKLQDKIIASKYDDNSRRQRVTEFKTNLLYHKQLCDPQIELSDLK